MNLKELRLGNYCQDKLTGAILQVIQLSEGEELRYTFKVIDRSKYPLPEMWQAEYIPLTPEILEKCGFEKAIENAGNLPCFKKGKLTIAKWANERWQCWIGTVDLHKSPQYLHQLQNLFFSLCGKELEVNI